MLAQTTFGLRRAFAVILVTALTLTGVSRVAARTLRPVDSRYAISGFHVPICHSDRPEAPSNPANPVEHDCCDACALLAPVVFPAPPVLSEPAPIEHFAEHARVVDRVPAIARPRSPKQSQGPPAA